MYPITTKYDIATIYGNNFGEYGVEKYDRKPLKHVNKILNVICNVVV